MIRGQGMPSFRHHHFGNMYIQFDVKFPEKNWTEDPQVFEELRKLLPVPALINVPPAEAMTEPADLEDVDPRGAQAFGGAGGANGMMMDDEDEDGHPQGGERVQCASQ